MKEMGGEKPVRAFPSAVRIFGRGWSINRMFWGKEQRFHFMKNRSKRPKACPGVIGIKFEDSIFPYIIDSIFLLCRRTYNPPFYMPRFRCDQTC